MYMDNFQKNILEKSDFDFSIFISTFIVVGLYALYIKNMDYYESVSKIKRCYEDTTLNKVCSNPPTIFDTIIVSKLSYIAIIIIALILSYLLATYLPKNSTVKINFYFIIIILSLPIIVMYAIGLITASVMAIAGGGR